MDNIGHRLHHLEDSREHSNNNHQLKSYCERIDNLDEIVADLKHHLEKQKPTRVVSNDYDQQIEDIISKMDLFDSSKKHQDYKIDKFKHRLDAFIFTNAKNIQVKLDDLENKFNSMEDEDHDTTYL